MKRVIIESPFAGKTPADAENNITYARLAVRDSLLRNEAPIASHLLYTQPGILDDLKPNERVHGIMAGLIWAEVAHYVAVYTDFGISEGMKQGIKHHESLGLRIEYRNGIV